VFWVAVAVLLFLVAAIGLTLAATWSLSPA
jgi:hypothetical protein